MRNQSILNAPVLVSSSEITIKEARFIALFRQLNDEAQGTYMRCFEDNLKCSTLRRSAPKAPAEQATGNNVFSLRSGARH